MATKKPKATGDKVFVRGPDGALYILSTDKPPYKLKAEEAQSVRRILSEAQKQVAEQLKYLHPAFGSMVNLNVPPLPPPR